MPNIRFHGLRHTASTHMLANGVDLLTVSRLLGHTKPSATLNTYAHTVLGLQEIAAAIMDEITTPVALPADLTAPKLHQNCTRNQTPDSAHLKNIPLKSKK